MDTLKGEYSPKIWDSFFIAEDRGRYPSEDLVRFIMNRYKKNNDRSHITILDLGCGEGPNIRFLQREGFNSIGVDGSFVALQNNKAITQAEKMDYKLVNADFTQLPFKKESIDCIIEISALQHNTFSVLRLIIINQIYDLLKKGGAFFSFCLKKGSCGYGNGEQIEENTFYNIKDSFCKSGGYAHFFTKKELLTLYGKFTHLSIDSIERTFRNGKYFWKHWIVSAQK